MDTCRREWSIILDVLCKYSALFWLFLCRLINLFYFLFAVIKCYALLCGTLLKYIIMKTLNYTQETIRERQVQEYLISQYGEDYFSLDDLLNMCICDDGSVWIGMIEFKTPFKID